MVNSPQHEGGSAKITNKATPFTTRMGVPSHKHGHNQILADFNIRGGSIP